MRDHGVRFETHDHARCTACGESGLGQPRVDRGGYHGMYRFELHCRCGSVTHYDVGCSYERHGRIKVDVQTFVRSTVFAFWHDDWQMVLGHCPHCGSSLMMATTVEQIPADLPHTDPWVRPGDECFALPRAS